MRNWIAGVAGLLLAGCELYSTDEMAKPDAAVVEPATCASTVIATCGPRPPRPAPDVQRDEQWAHDVDLWAKCAEWATPRLAE